MPPLLRRALLLVWELPQNLLGATLLALQAVRGHVAEVRFERERLLIELRSIGAVSLGLFVFFARKDNPYVPVGAESLDHELGHSVQSRWLGWLYLPVVGLTSELRLAYAVFHRHLRGRRWAGYYDGFPERQADELGGVDRALRPKP